MYKDEAYLKVDEKGNVTDESALIEQAEGKGMPISQTERTANTSAHTV